MGLEQWRRQPFGSATPPAPFRLRVLRVTYSQPIRFMSNKLNKLRGRANNVSYEVLDDECCSISGCYPVPRPLTLKMTLNIKNKGHIRIRRPNLDI